MLPFLVNGLVFGSVVGLLSLAYAISFWPSRQFHFAFASVLLAVSYAVWFTSGPLGWPPIAVGVIAALTAIGVGVGVHRFLYRPLVDPSAVLLTALGFTLAFQNVINLVFGTAFHGLKQSEFSTTVVALPFDIYVAMVQIGGVVVCLSVAIALIVFIRRSRVGIAMRALSSDPFLTEAVGIDANRMNIYAYALGSAAATIAMLFIIFDVGVNPDVGTNPLFYALNGVIIGGFRSFGGAFLGGLLLGVFMNIGIWQLPSQWQTTIAFGLLLIVVIFRPNGLFGRKT